MRSVVGALVLVGMLALTGCVGGERLPTLPPTPTSTPIFASEEEALAAAEAAYAAYQAAVDFALQTLDPSGLSAVATGEALSTALASVESFQAAGKRQIGLISVDSVRPTDLSALTEGGRDDVAQIYACLDLSQVTVVNSAGEISQSSVLRIPMIAGVRWDGSALLVAEEEVWDGSDFCN